MPSRAVTGIGAPRPVRVHRGAHGMPAAVEKVAVECLLEEWVVEDRWWTGRPLRRRYFECVLENGRNVVVFLDLVRRRWYEQRA
jgi:hypothetical protein